MVPRLIFAVEFAYMVGHHRAIAHKKMGQTILLERNSHREKVKPFRVLGYSPGPIWVIPGKIDALLIHGPMPKLYCQGLLQGAVCARLC